jgi:hypothetical protein
MSAVNDARAHLEKAREFLEAAEMSRDLDLYNAATSDAVIPTLETPPAARNPGRSRPGCGTAAEKAPQVSGVSS